MLCWCWRFLASLGLLSLVRCEYTKIGNCTRTEFFHKNKQCTLDFFVSIRTNPKGNCNTYYLLMVDCTKNVMKSCLENGDNLSSLVDTTLGMVYAKGDIESKYCREGGLPLTAVTQAPHAQEKRCAERYYRQTPKCGEDFIERFRINPADYTLCEEYTRVIDCAKFKIEQYCTRSEARDLRNNLAEDFNPYCEADEIIAERSLKNWNNKSSASNMSHSWEMFILRTACVAFAFKFLLLRNEL
ncbi:uncharacterized protein LOC144443642 [Glandiceps talaboti]